MKDTPAHDRPIYAICDWDERHETNESRKRKIKFSWVTTPVELDSVRMRALAKTPAHAGVWHYIVQLAAKGRREHRGYLVCEQGRPLSDEQI